jgi:hypothetical protein
MPGVKVKKVNFALEQAMRTQREAEIQLYSFFNLGTRRGGSLTPRPGRFTPGKEARYTLYRRLGEPQGRTRLVLKISLSPGLDHRTVQHVASRNIVCANYVVFLLAHLQNCEKRLSDSCLSVSMKEFGSNWTDSR